MSKVRTLTESQMNKWKTLVALTHVDGGLSGEERGFIEEFLKKRKVSPDQIQEIEAGFNSPESPADLFLNIESAKDRSELFYLARLMFFKDGEFCDFEKMFYDKFKAKHMSGIDIKAVMAEVQKIEVEEMKKREDKEAGQSLFERFLNRLV